MEKKSWKLYTEQQWRRRDTHMKNLEQQWRRRDTQMKNSRVPIGQSLSAMENRRYGFWKSVRDGDFQEEDVWDVLDDEFITKQKQITKPSFSIRRSLPSATKMIPRMTTGVNVISPKQEGNEMSGMRQNSAPVNIPDWSEIQIKKSKKKDDDDDDDDDDEGSEDDVAPQEYFLARSRSSSSECCGRSLKGRDLRRVRNAVLKQTGFLE